MNLVLLLVNFSFLSSATFTHLPSLSSLSAGFAATGIYNPSLPTSYADCVFDPNDKNTTIEILDPRSGIPIVNYNGVASLAVEVYDKPPKFYFVKPANSPSGVYDLVLSDRGYLAVYLNGTVGFVSASSEGTAFLAGADGEKYTTTIWSLLCDGQLSSGIWQGPEIRFRIINNDLVAFFGSTEPVPLGNDEKAIPAISIVLFALIIPPSTATPANPTNYARCPGPTLGCPTFKPGQSVDTITTNGCGADLGISSYVPELQFHECCNGHDRCYGTCSTTFENCNIDFVECNLAACERLYPISDPFDPTQRLRLWGCTKQAQLYGWGVTTEIGKGAYESATKEFCDCAELLKDPANCGSCGNDCDSGKCFNGVCLPSAPDCIYSLCGSDKRCPEGCVCYQRYDDSYGFCYRL